MSIWIQPQTLGKILVGIGVGQLLFVLGNKLFDPYQYKLAGILFEALWLPFILSMFITPLIALFHWIKQKCLLRSYYLLALLITGASLAVLFYQISSVEC